MFVGWMRGVCCQFGKMAAPQLLVSVIRCFFGEFCGMVWDEGILGGGFVSRLDVRLFCNSTQRSA